MEGIGVEEILNEVTDMKSLQNPESHNFIKHKNIGENLDFIGSEDYETIIVDNLNENIFFDFERYIGADYYRAVEFGENYTLIESIIDNSINHPDVNDDFKNKDESTVIYFLATNEQSYMFERSTGYKEFSNPTALEIHKKSQNILEEKDFFSRKILEPAE